jgi:hypothetical protein
VFNQIQQAFGANTDDMPGRRLRLEMDGERIVGVVPERAPDRHVEIAEADVVPVDGSKILVMRMVDPAGKPEGRVDIVFESDDPDEQVAGQRQLARFFDAVGMQLRADTDSDELVGRVLTLTGEGDFEQASVDMAVAAWPVRTAAVRRDDFKCQECGERGRLEVHHVIPVRLAPELAYDLGNLKTLCVACHLQKTLAERGQLPSPEREAWATLLQKGI